MTKTTLAELELQFAPSAIDLRADLEFDAARRRVFDAVLHVAAWWPHRPWVDTRVVLEARVGGRFFEDRNDGCGILLGHVTRLVPPGEFAVVGPLGLDGLANAVWTLNLQAADDVRGADATPEDHFRTLAHGRFRAFGVIDDEIRVAAPAYWDAVYAALTAYVHS